MKKTSSGEDRLVELDGTTVGVLLVAQLAQKTERDDRGDAYADHGLVFAREEPITAWSLRGRTGTRWRWTASRSGSRRCAGRPASARSGCTTFGTVLRRCG
nr:hypothetical protein [Plantactinospora alkalitolerans]